MGDVPVDIADLTTWSEPVFTTRPEGAGDIAWLWMVVCTEEEDVMGRTGFCALTLCVAWLKSPSACNIWAGCEVMATMPAVEGDGPASILEASLGIAHCTTTPARSEGLGSA